MIGALYIFMWLTLFILTSYHEDQWDMTERILAKVALLLGLLIGIIMTV